MDAKNFNGRTVKLGTTTKGVTYYLVNKDGSGKNLRHIVGDNGRSVPPEMQGLFTDGKAAKVAFDAYIARVSSKRPRANGEQASDEDDE